MAEKYAPEAPVKDLRIQEFAYAATDMKVVDPTVKETATEYDSARVLTALKSGTTITKVKDEEIFKKPSDKELEKIEDASRTVKDDATKTADQRAAAEILEQIAKKQREVKEKLDKGEKVKYARSQSMFNSITLFTKPTTPKLTAKLELYSAKREVFNTYLANRFATGALSFSDKLLRKDATTTKVLSGAVEPSKKYSEL
tara:strand:+ start:178 stop:777 length:600 start_codon:yes stop_codon:yes gene_type:complete